MKESKTLKWMFISVGGIIMCLISFTLIYDLLIPDLCYYHLNEMNSFLNLFYSAGPADNGHPSPNLLNLIISLITGGILGNGIYKYLTNKNKRKIKTTANIV
ncbi:hypothetical protein KO500_00050 [Cellulophaga baltica]|uniref:hypothetical protein n=1 Tax=Cellulophaga TaxID=104264 RepID=UPI001C06DE61|nr:MULTISPECIES: hypothetical protein [Cellulophaga]MBU2994805.1 hypothetical protein [Cellulophaga baltica]MDO6766200.1 hypothetical protein [Cellulophaga sp. 1_MG-2023]